MPTSPLEQQLIFRNMQEASPNMTPPTKDDTYFVKPGQYDADLAQPPMPPWERLQLAQERVGVQMPKAAAAAGEPSIMPSWLSRMMSNDDGTVYGATNPWTSKVMVNRDAAANMSQEELEDLLAHEYTHVNQYNGRGVLEKLQRNFASYFTPYRDNPDEQEAFGSTLRRKAHRQDIQLIKERK